jgi:nucleotide-binding universal stress UspA family protein
VVLVLVNEEKSVDYPSSPYKFSHEQQAKATVSLIEQKKKSQAVLDNAKACLSELPGRVDTVILEGNPAEVILEYANKRSFDLIVMGSKGMSGLKSLFIGSVTRRVALKTTRPILIVR